MFCNKTTQENGFLVFSGNPVYILRENPHYFLIPSQLLCICGAYYKRWSSP